ncbi:MAG: class I SAM-dependent methyltransferase [Vulcanibacillus sp.]
MTDHYYSQVPVVKNDRRYLKVHFLGKDFNFVTDSGVFSKQKIDFGTSLLIESFNGTKSAKVLDMGCGYGPLGIVISSSMDSGKVILVDINERAIELTKGNIFLNKESISKNVELSAIQSDGFTTIEETEFNYILLNPPIRAGKTIVYKLYEQAFQYLVKDGEIWIVIRKKQGALSSIDKLKTIYKKIEIINREKGYYILKGTK